MKRLYDSVRLTKEFAISVPSDYVIDAVNKPIMGLPHAVCRKFVAVQYTVYIDKQKGADYNVH
jgi:hypothetical protein